MNKEKQEKQDNINKMYGLVAELNKFRDHYYNKQESLVSDYEYDCLFDKLKELEEKTGVVLSSSPTITVGYEVKSGLQKVKHSHPMLSLDKTKSTDDLIKFAGEHDCLLSLKMDGLTVLLTYQGGELFKAETRGNGEEGEDITHNAMVFENIPLRIPYTGTFEVEGEAIITYEDFENINNAISEEDKKYKNPRNLVSGSVRQLDSNIAAQRHIKFIAWKPLHRKDSIWEGLRELKEFGFTIVPYHTFSGNCEEDKKNIKEIIDALKAFADVSSYPIDGMVMTYDDIQFGKSLGMTGHHPKHSIAYKFYDEVSETSLVALQWDIGKHGTLTPVALFEPVEIDGTTVSKASVHNISILKKLELTKGDLITVYKANQVIPQIADNLSAIDRNNNGIYYDVIYPKYCPICGSETIIKKDNESEVLYCTNENCRGRLLGKLNHFVSKNAMNIDGLSELTLNKLIKMGYLKDFEDIYLLNEYHYDDIFKLDGFNTKSLDKMMAAIEASKNTTLDRFIYALSIPLIGRSASKTISKYFNGDFEKFFKEGCLQYFDYEQLDDFGTVMANSMNQYLQENIHMIRRLSDYMTFKIKIVNNNENKLSGMTFVITGSVNEFKNREEVKTWIESHGGNVSGSVSKKTSYLVNNDITSTSGKNKKAKELGVAIITENDLLAMVK